MRNSIYYYWKLFIIERGYILICKKTHAVFTTDCYSISCM